MNVFYDRFERHAHGEGLKGRTTHYCPGCGHGLVQKFLAEAIDELGIQDRTIAVSPVGCAVFMYYYLDVGNTQAAHGRAPAVAVAHKLANPDAVVVSYQGDGDLASIGLAEIIATAELGIPISVVFVNNAIYGMTGGQMAPTTLPGQVTATSPAGRGTFEGRPLRMAELIAQLDGPVYVERVALYDPKQRNRTKKAIRRALELQVERRGFSFVEVLSECPTHLGKTPEEAEAWVRDEMTKFFPLGVLKELEVEPRPELPRPDYSPERLLAALGTSTEPPPRFAERFPSHLDARDVAIKFAGAGGDGAQTAAMLVTHAAIHEGFDATHIPSYGPESRGGTSYADVRMAKGEVLSPAAPRPHVVVAFNPPSVEKFAPMIVPGGFLIYDSAVVAEPPPLGPGCRAIGVPLSEIAAELGQPRIKNVVALGVLQAATGLLPEESFLFAIREALQHKAELVPLNEQAFRRGVAGT
ncbi:MAG TPA: 2-oxoacid:acceptor oxidoreductase family protein [Thermoanaerobaculia bacterium]|nr:2-oxoacid:acceptor oxidoreductase family protein [Thermoanaerobaculia bacterium]